ncbi:MAG: hypothetical protein ACLFR7_00035 [Opitutales bacterium]
MMDRLEQSWNTVEPYWPHVVEYFTDPLVWAILLVGVLLLVIVRLRRRRRPIVLYRNKGGNVEIARATLRGLIIGAAQCTPGVDLATCTYDQKRKKLRLAVRIHLSSEASLPKVEENLRHNIRTALHEHVGYEPTDIAPIHIRVTKITGEHNVTPRQLLLEEEERELKRAEPSETASDEDVPAPDPAPDEGPARKPVREER